MRTNVEMNEHHFDENRLLFSAEQSVTMRDSKVNRAMRKVHWWLEGYGSREKFWIML